jgi:hypothetical protein
MSRSTARKRAENKNLDKDVELVKIHVFSERVQARFTTVVSTSFAIFLGFTVVFYTLFFENVLNIEIFIISITVLTGGTVFELYRVHRGFRQEIKKISDLIEEVKKGKELPKLEELMKS